MDKGLGTGWTLSCERGLFFHWEEKGTMGNRQDKFRKGEVCRCSRERGCRVKLSERSAEAGGDCCGEDIVEFSGNLAGEEALLYEVLCDHESRGSPRKGRLLGIKSPSPANEIPRSPLRQPRRGNYGSQHRLNCKILCMKYSQQRESIDYYDHIGRRNVVQNMLFDRNTINLATL